MVDRPLDVGEDRGGPADQGVGARWRRGVGARPQRALHRVDRGGGHRVVGQGDGVVGGGPVRAELGRRDRSHPVRGLQPRTVARELRRGQRLTRLVVQEHVGRVGRAWRQSLFEGLQRGLRLGAVRDARRGQVEGRVIAKRGDREPGQHQAGHRGEPARMAAERAADRGEPGRLGLFPPRLGGPEHPGPEQRDHRGDQRQPGDQRSGHGDGQRGPDGPQHAQGGQGQREERRQSRNVTKTGASGSQGECLHPRMAPR